MVCLSLPFDFYCGGCFDRVGVLFNSRICVFECPVRVNCPRQTFISADVVSIFLFLRVYSVYIYIYILG